MNAFAARLLWGVLQVTLFTLAGLAVYLLARRRGPAAGALAAAACLSMAVGVSALALAPWPHWYTLAPSEHTENAAPASVASAATPEARVPLDEVEDSSAPSPKRDIAPLSRFDEAAAAWQGFWQGLRNPRAAETAAEAGKAPAAPRWPAMLGVIFVAGLVLAVVRLALGLFAVRRLRARTTPIADASLEALVDDLRRRLGAARAIELRQSHELASPVTVGWRRPLVILPDDWREWTESERRVVLAHEIAHVGRGDYFTAVLAQLSVALHFYHPLVHWLARRLRLELELAADALGAEASGGREAYLITLAQMALRHDDRAIAWAARPFLPSRGAFLRRIDMLRDPKQFRSAAMSRGRQFAIIGCVAAAGLLFAGLRGPQGQSVAQQPGKAAPPPAEQAAEIDWSFVPPNAPAVAIIRPAAMLAKPEMEPLVKLFNEQAGVEQQLGLKATELEEIKLIAPYVPDPTMPGAQNYGVFMLRAKAAHDWKTFGEKIAGPTVEANFLGKTYAKPENRPRGFSYYLADERTIVVAAEPQLQRLLALQKTSPGKPKWADQWLAGDAAAMLDLKTYNAVLGAQVKEDLARTPAIASFSPVWEQTDRVFANVSISDGIRITATAHCGSPEAAANVSKTAEAALTLAANLLAQLGGQIPAAQNNAQEAGAMLILADMGAALLKNEVTKIEGNAVRFETRVDADAADTLVAVLSPAIQSARESARRGQSMNNMKLIMLAMHNYYDVNKHLPAAVVIGPDGKTPHSWRVEILPYLEQEPLYRQYKMDEPWDSENNKRVLAQMPAVFRHAGDNPTSTNASYFAITGETTIFPGTEGIEFKEVRDGLSNTITVVEAQRPIPWTKPEDIAYDPAKPLPKLGGHEAGVFTAATADGAVRNIAQNIDEKVLRAMFTRAGGEITQLPQGN